MTGMIYVRRAMRDKKIVVPGEAQDSQAVRMAKAEERFARQNNKDRCDRMTAARGGKITIRKFSFDD